MPSFNNLDLETTTDKYIGYIFYFMGIQLVLILTCSFIILSFKCLNIKSIKLKKNNEQLNNQQINENDIRDIEDAHVFDEPVKIPDDEQITKV